MKLKILWVGKTKSAPLKDLIGEYCRRIEHLAPLEVVELRDSLRSRSVAKEDVLSAEAESIGRSIRPGSRVVALDEAGRQLSSMELARWIEMEQNQGAKELLFIIGGPDGLSAGISCRAELKLSLGRMTWTHEICRVLLLEQIYRAYTILRGIPYHK
jgi:23S rRNA (pseudouridine1915-N3)-methyltransferase